MKNKLLYGIQQIGVGVTDIRKAEKWYVQVLHANIKVLEDSTPAHDMAPYMGGKPRTKIAVILLNEFGGGGFELWQHTEHTLSHVHELSPGDYGINYVGIYTSDIKRADAHFQFHGVNTTHLNNHIIQISDPFGNNIRIIQKELPRKYLLTGIHEVGIGVSESIRAVNFYQLLGFAVTGKEQTDDLIITRLVGRDHSSGRLGTFLGDCTLNLIERRDTQGKKIYQNRFWGEPGFIHLCFDVYNLNQWVDCFKSISPFTVLSKPVFHMGEAQGQWGYVEDPDETLIEMVETHYIPIIKKLGIGINLKNKPPHKALPKWLIKAISLKKVHL